MYQSKVDAKGRLTLPAEVHLFFSKLGTDKVFVTSLDEQIARIYPITVWVDQLRSLHGTIGDNAESAADLCFTANRLGTDAQLDTDGCVTLSQELLTTLNLQGQNVYLHHEKGHFKVFTQAVYQYRVKQSRQNINHKLQQMERCGLQ